MCGLMCPCVCSELSEVHVRIHPLSPLGAANKSPKEAPKKLRLSPALSALASVGGGVVSRGPQAKAAATALASASPPSRLRPANSLQIHTSNVDATKVFANLPAFTVAASDAADKLLDASRGPPGLELQPLLIDVASVIPKVVTDGVKPLSSAVGLRTLASSSVDVSSLNTPPAPLAVHAVVPVNKFKLLNKTELCKFFATGACKRSSGKPLSFHDELQ